ncbi:MotE family protein [Paenibacillus sp. IHBB 10380]|uniref:MotE family protein n=1 Tax=Paenibacillus sp. IHBB 10380 TaxID=1566358 RepID=UPI000698DDB6|nr:kinesin [Paenibacillus sp. IHBB 10380]
MAQNDFEVENETSGGFERFLLFMIPIVFTIVLLGVLLALFNTNIRNTFLELANKVPIVEKWVPDPSLDPEKSKLDKTKDQLKSTEATNEELKNKLSEQEAALVKATEGKVEQENKVQELQTQIDTMKQEIADKATVAAAGGETEISSYQQQINDLAKMYADMNPRKSAPIIQNLTQEEIVLLFEAMKTPNRVAILEKMDPKVAAEVTTLMKEAKSSTDLQVAALQSRLKKNQTAATSTPASTKLNETQLSQTFATMTPKSAADLLFQTYKISPDKVLTILNSVDNVTRSAILGKMSTDDSATTAKILNKLMSSK